MRTTFACRRWSRCRDDEGAALLLALFVILSIASLSIAIAGVVLAQSKPTQLIRKDVRTVHAAEGGMDVALGRIRNSLTTAGDGDRTKLPCVDRKTGGATLSGSLGPDQGNLAFSVKISYYTSDPTGQSASWLDANYLKCASGGGLSVAPSYALIVSDGTGSTVPNTPTGTGDRQLTAVYNFLLTNANISGGEMILFQTNFCIDASTNPKVGTTVTMQKCTGTPQQTWSYTSDLLIQLTGMANNTLCLSGNPNNKAGTVIKLDSCDATQAAQVWSFNDYGEYEGANFSTGKTDGYCFKTAGVTGTPITLAAECSAGHDSVHTWAPDPKVGAGKSGPLTGQLVNYQEFGRCLDVTDQTVSKAWLIDYPCKQTPDPKWITWNQKWAGPDSQGRIITNNGSNYCLTAGTSRVPAISGTRVLTTPCFTTTADKSQQWTSIGKLSSWSDSYEFVSKNGNNLCLSLAPAPPEAGSGYPWSMIVVETCNGTAEQKWNAPPEPTKTGIDTWETTS